MNNGAVYGLAQVSQGATLVYPYSAIGLL